MAFVFPVPLTNGPPALAGSRARQRVAMSFLAPLTNVPPASAGSGARQREDHEFSHSQPSATPKGVAFGFLAPLTNGPPAPDSFKIILSIYG